MFGNEKSALSHKKLFLVGTDIMGKPPNLNLERRGKSLYWGHRVSIAFSSKGSTCQSSTSGRPGLDPFREQM